MTSGLKNELTIVPDSEGESQEIVFWYPSDTSNGKNFQLCSTSSTNIIPDNNSEFSTSDTEDAFNCNANLSNNKISSNNASFDLNTNIEHPDSVIRHSLDIPIMNKQKEAESTEQLYNQHNNILDKQERPLRWSLRKRKAIQKMPYSLDRLKHKQLLKGYEVLNFDSINVNDLPEISLSFGEKNHNKFTNKQQHTQHPLLSTQDDFWQDSDDDYDFEIQRNISFQNSATHTDSSDNRSTDSEESIILPRKLAKQGILEEGNSDNNMTLLSCSNTNSDENDVSTSKISQLSEDTSKKETDNIIFRGRVISLKNGYKGVLPKAIWEKQIKATEGTVVPNGGKKTRGYINNTVPHKGVAKRKITRNPRNNQYQELLNDILASDDEEPSETNNVNSNISTNSSDSIMLHTINAGIEDAKAAAEINEYFEKKYNEFYTSDYLSLSSNDKSIAQQKQSSTDLSNQNLRRHSSGAENISVHTFKNNIDSSDDSINIKKMEGNIIDLHDYPQIDYMLSKRSKIRGSSSNTINNGTSKRKKNVTRRTRILRDKRQTRNFNAPKFFKIGRNISKNNDLSSIGHAAPSIVESIAETSAFGNNVEYAQSGSVKRIGNGRSGNGINVFAKTTTPETKDTHKLNKTKNNNKENDKKGKRKIGLYTTDMLLGDDIELNRKINAFTTIVEAPGNKYVLNKVKRKPAVPAGGHTDVSDSSAERIATNKSVLLDTPIFKALSTNSLFQAPDTISYFIAQEKITLSSFSNEFLKQLAASFDKIVRVGITDVELLDFLGKLIEFCYHRNNSDILPILDSFQTSFRSKLRQVAQRAKPIHFFTLSVCLLIEFEVSNYSSITSSFRSNIESKILRDSEKYFELLSNMSVTVSRFGQTDFLAESHFIVSFLINKLNMKDKFWAEISSKRCLSPKILNTVLYLFPTKTPYWNIISLENQDFPLVSASINFIQFAINDYDWIITKELVLKLHLLFKSRSFTNFEQECNNKDGVCRIVNRNFGIEPDTIFNFYLTVLNNFVITDSLIEKITPLGSITTMDGSQIPNRINLLLTLTLKSDFLFEKKYEQLITSALSGFPDIGVFNYKYMLEGLLSLFEVSNQKNQTINGNCILIFYEYQKNKPNVKGSYSEVWCDFIGHLCKILPNFGTNKQHLLYSLRHVASQMVKDGNYDSVVLIMILGLVTKNLKLLPPRWVESNLYQLLSTVCFQNFKLFKIYCDVVKYLIQSHILTLWSVLSYNSSVAKLPVEQQCYYYESLLEVCNEESSFLLIKPAVMKIILSNIFNDKFDLKFLKLVKSFFDKDPSIKTPFRVLALHSTFTSIKQILLGFDEAHNLGFFNEFLKLLKAKYLNKVKVELCREITIFINASLNNLVRSNQIFEFLKKEFKISNFETEKSAFKQKYITLSNIQDKVNLILLEILQVLENKLDIEETKLKIESLFALKKKDYADEFNLLLEIILCCIYGNSALSFYISTILFAIISNVLEQKMMVTTNNEFLILLKFLHNISNNIRFKKNLTALLPFYYCLSCFYLDLKYIGSGFKESEIIEESIDKFMGRCKESSRIEDLKLDNIVSHQVLELIKKFESTIEIEKFYEEKDYEMFSSKIEDICL
ncbi:uncharacterized protein SCODWIG_00400 [Saccharomycodes ludwigii]|uniref:Uncharacterized protein n=1 Tax=Saccharomycodes ludwigii TaxID=36035 RepID=A0A376B1Z6_9ASCO|nr:uncharacterized protein SCODWIG_00400 [Saccharomycodes ludwigii]